MTAYEELLEKAYELYKADWCASRGYDLALVQETELKDEEYNGEMYASLGEFEAVSYTHLDVYKRQPWEPAFPPAHRA